MAIYCVIVSMKILTGSVVTSHLRTNKIEFPAFLVVNRTRGTNEVVAVIEGTASNETMMHRLMQTFEMFEGQRISDMNDESERETREQIKRDQDMAYQVSRFFLYLPNTYSML